MNKSYKQSNVGRVIFVDKDSNMRNMMAMILNEQFHVVTACSAEEGLALLEAEEHFDIVISGLTLMFMNGLEFLRRVSELCPQTVRILMSGGGDRADINQAIREGSVSRYILKPFCLSTLLDQLSNDLVQVRNTLITTS
jgi:DNA-binding NtrC family response regulator